MDAMIDVQNLRKTFGSFVAVSDVSFKLQRGEVLGFLGPNGAGKSTAMKMITGFLTPSGGSITVKGSNVAVQPLAVKSAIGYLPEGAPCYAEMTPGSFLDFIADIRGLEGNERKARLDEVVEMLHLGPVLHQSIDTLSKGFKRRVGLAQAILHDPDVLILDEPTDGLDPNQKHEVRELIHSMSAEKLIVISTHILEEVEAVCSRAIIIANGRILADDTPHNLAMQSRYHNAVRLSLGDDDNFDEVEAAVAKLDSVDTTESDREHGTITAVAKSGSDGASNWHKITDLVNNSNWNISGLQLEAGRLDEVFRQITRGEKV